MKARLFLPDDEDECQRINRSLNPPLRPGWHRDPSGVPISEFGSPRSRSRPRSRVGDRKENDDDDEKEESMLTLGFPIHFRNAFTGKTIVRFFCSALRP